LSLKLAARLVPINTVKIADLQENDTATHELDLSAILPKGTICILIRAARQSGSGNFLAYPLSHSGYIQIGVQSIDTLPIKDRILKWSSSVANDDWDIYLYGYFVQKRTR